MNCLFNFITTRGRKIRNSEPGGGCVQWVKIEAKIRACLSRAITSAVAATFNDEMRQLQLNAVASSMVPPAPDRRAKDPALVGLKSSKNARAFPPSSSVLTLYNRLSAIVAR